MVVLRGVAPKGTFVAIFLPYLRLYINTREMEQCRLRPEIGECFVVLQHMQLLYH